MRKLMVSVFAMLCGSSVFAGAGADKVGVTSNANVSGSSNVIKKNDINATTNGTPSVETQMAELAQELQKVDNETKNFSSLNDGSDSGMSSLGDPKTLKDIKALKLNEVNASEFFKYPNAFASCLEPGYWIEVPHAIDGGWSASLLITKETLLPIIEGRVDGIAGALVNQAMLKSRAPDDKAFVDTIKYAFAGLIDCDEVTKKNLERLRLCELTTYSEFLKENGLERFDHGDEFSERPQVGIPVKYLNGRLIIDANALQKSLAKRLAVALKIEEIMKTIQTISSRRDEMITPEMKEQLGIIKKITEENAELSKRIEECKKLGTDYSEFETRLNENEEKLKTLELERGVQTAKMYEEGFEQRSLEQLDKIEDYFVRLSALDPSAMSADELRSKKISKETREKIEELKILKKKNEELKQKMEDAKAKTKDPIAKLEEEKKTAEEELEQANKNAETLKKKNRKITPKVQKPIDAATEKISKIEAQIKATTQPYAEFEAQYNANSLRIQSYENDKDVIIAQRLLEKKR